jgi:hypothetical protein
MYWGNELLTVSETGPMCKKPSRFCLRTLWDGPAVGEGEWLGEDAGRGRHWGVQTEALLQALGQVLELGNIAPA